MFRAESSSSCSDGYDDDDDDNDDNDMLVKMWYALFVWDVGCGAQIVGVYGASFAWGLAVTQALLPLLSLSLPLFLRGHSCQHR